MAPPLPLAHLWEMYIDLQAWRGFDRTEGMPRILSLDVMATWARLTDTEIGPFELGVFTKLEAAFWDAKAPAPQGKPTLFKQMRTLAEQDGKLRTVPINTGKK